MLGNAGVLSVLFVLSGLCFFYGLAACIHGARAKSAGPWVVGGLVLVAIGICLTHLLHELTR